MRQKTFRILPINLVLYLSCFIYSCIPTTSVNAKSHTETYVISLNTRNFSGILSVVFIFFIILIYYIERKKNSEMQKISFTDPLTGGSNFLKFEHDAKLLFDKNGLKDYAVLYLDIDKFKYINELYDYTTGNETLIRMYNILKRNIFDNELCARINSDCFALLIKCPSANVLSKRVQKIFEDISKLKHIGCDHYELIISCGIYVSDSTVLNINSMVDLANIARVTVKGGHKSSYEFYSDDLHDKIINEKILENHMTMAVSNKEFLLYFQPKYNLAKKKIVSAEALVRWQNPIRGLLLPAEFIPLFEKNGFIVTLDLYVFETVCRQLRWWIDNNYAALPISLNISRVSLRQTNFIKNLQEILKKYNISANMIELELTESALFENQDILYGILSSLKEIGFTLTVDDFGSGYSSLYMLKEIPIDILKIDKNFLTGNYNTARNKIILKKIIEMAKLLNITVVSEGVETMVQAELLIEVGCDIAQGYLFSIPVNLNEFNIILQKIETNNVAI